MSSYYGQVSPWPHVTMSPCPHLIAKCPCVPMSPFLCPSLLMLWLSVTMATCPGVHMSRCPHVPVSTCPGVHMSPCPRDLMLWPRVPMATCPGLRCPHVPVSPRSYVPVSSCPRVPMSLLQLTYPLSFSFI